MNELLLRNQRTNRERVILPSSRSKIKKKILSSLTNQHSVILPYMLLVQIMLVKFNFTAVPYINRR